MTFSEGGITMTTRSGWRICFGVPNDFQDKDHIARKCLEVANAAQFPTDFEDVFEHLFGNENYKICLILDEEDQIYGFSIFAKLEEINTLHLHGIVLHPEAQGNELSLKMVETAIANESPMYLTAKTHNPRAFEALSKFALDESAYYPNANNDVIPEHIYELVKQNEFVSTADRYLIVRNAYPDEKIAQSYRNKNISRVFARLHAFDAQVIAVKLK